MEHIEQILICKASFGSFLLHHVDLIEVGFFSTVIDVLMLISGATGGKGQPGITLLRHSGALAIITAVRKHLYLV